jgi:hypothetical protein
MKMCFVLNCFQETNYISQYIFRPQRRSGRRGEEKILDSTVVEPVASRYTDCSTPASPNLRINFSLIRIVEDGVETGSTRHVGYF